MEYPEFLHPRLSEMLAYESQTAVEKSMPHYLYHARLYRDGDRWCALIGENIQDGVVGFGNTPAKAMAAFDDAWNEEIKPRAAAQAEEKNNGEK